MAAPRKKIVVITGPTAAGKTELAINLAAALKGVIVSADSRQVYAGMNIGTATPLPAAGTGQEPHSHLEPDIIRNIPHYLFSIRRPNEPLSLAEWQASALEVIDHELESRSKNQEAIIAPLLVGGTMLYIDSILKNYYLPQVEPNVQMRYELAAREADDLYAELMAQDPAAQTFIEPGNKRRIIRALEVIAATKKPFSAQRRSTSSRHGRSTSSRYDITMIGLFDGWEGLLTRITQRAKFMISHGLLGETQSLIDVYGADLPLLQTMNYKQAAAVLRGEMSERQAHESMVRANMRYARRQMSWWRGREEIRWFRKPDAAAILKLW